MKFSHKGMTFIELVVVITIISIIYSLSLITLKHEKTTDPNFNLSMLRTTLQSLSISQDLRLFCDLSCQECRILTNDGKIFTTAHLQTESRVVPYVFDRNGDIQEKKTTLVLQEGRLSQGCFEFSLHSDGTSTPLILKDKNTFYVYTPLQDDKPYITTSEEDVRKYLYNEIYYPLKGDDAYAGE